MTVAAMIRRRLLCGLLLLSAVLACFVGWLWIASRPRVTRERFGQVKEGMTREEVIRTVGVPTGV
jgi:outer membrane protein assembly factor BamE (lipoprotein component of BamABCDE complex)